MTTFETNEGFRPFLLGDERILWSGQPKQGVLLGGRDALLIPFSLLWGLPFLLVGLYMIAGRFWHDAWLRRNLVYAVTDQRVLVLRGAKRPTITSLDIHCLPRLEPGESRDGTGTIGFEAASPFSGRSMNGFGWWVPALGGATQFFRIDQPRKVYDLIRKQSQP
jgi:hypothetical protein